MPIKNKKTLLNLRLFPEELFGLLMLSAMLILSFVFHDKLEYNRITGRHYFRFFTYTLLLYFLFGGKLKSIGKIIRNFFPLILITTVFENLGDVITKINPYHADWTLIKIDKFLFGGDASLWMERFYTPWLNNLMHSAYTSYYLIPPLIGMLLYLSGNYKAFRNFVVAVAFTAFLGYIGYVLVPAIGPKFVLAHLYTKSIKTGALMTQIAKVINDYEPFRADCFPSLHTAHTLVAMMYAYKYIKKIFSIPFCMCGSLLIISTVYGRHHYVIDVIAGILLAIFNVIIAARINEFWYKKVFIGNWREHYPESINWQRAKQFFKFKFINRGKNNNK